MEVGSDRCIRVMKLGKRFSGARTRLNKDSESAYRFYLCESAEATRETQEGSSVWHFTSTRGSTYGEHRSLRAIEN